MVSIDSESVSLTAFPVLLPQFSIKAAVRIKNKIFFILFCKSKKLLQTFFLLQVVYSKTIMCGCSKGDNAFEEASFVPLHSSFSMSGQYHVLNCSAVGVCPPGK